MFVNLSKIITDWAYKLNDGIPAFNDATKILLLQDTLRSAGWGEQAIKEFTKQIIERKVGDDEMIKYKDFDGNPAEMKAGSAKQQPNEHPAKQAYDKLVGEDEPEDKSDSEEPTEPKSDELPPDDDSNTDDDIESDTESETEKQKQIAKVLNTPEPGSDNTIEKETDVDQNKSELISKDHEVTDRQLMMTKTEAAAQAKQKGVKGVGAGTPESRAGEAMVHKGLRMLQEGKSIEEISEYFKKIVNSEDHVLNSASGKKWVKSALATLTKINETIGSENIDIVSWDTPEGRKAIGVDPKLETSSDMFVRTKDGRNIGISLKKDGSVFLNNGGWDKQSQLLLNSLKSEMPEDAHKRLSEAMSIDTYKKDLEDRFKYVTRTVGVSEVKKSFKKLLENPEDQKQFKGSSRDVYFKILSDPETLIKKLELGTTNTNEQKAYAKLLQTYHVDEYKHLRESDNGLTKRAFDTINSSEDAKRGMKSHIIKSMHISETLGLNETIKDGGVDEFMTTYGIDPDGAVLNENTLITLFGSRFKQTLDESLNEVRAGRASKEDLDRLIQDSIEIDYDSGQILFKHENNKKYPLFYMAGRTRGIGSSPIMEMAQTPFMAHALKQGTFNTDEWDEESLKRFEADIVDMQDQTNTDK